MTTKRGSEVPRFVLDNEIITPVEELEYLGVELSRKLRFKPHLIAVVARSSNTIRALSRIFSNFGGSGQKKRKLLVSVIHS